MTLRDVLGSPRTAYPDTKPEAVAEVLAGWLMETGQCDVFCPLAPNCWQESHDPADCIAALVHEAKEAVK